MPSSRLKGHSFIQNQMVLGNRAKNRDLSTKMAWKFQEFGLNLLCKKKSLLTQIQLMFWNHLVMITYLGQSTKSTQKQVIHLQYLEMKKPLSSEKTLAG